MTNLHLDKIRTLVIPLPPLDEQEEILRKTQDQLAPTETAISRTQREIALLREYRARLTADVVTGKLDVREAARKLPDTAEEAGGTLEIEELTDVEAEDVEA